ncbi:MAG: VOC family protein [Acidimicrobiales bacterium]
MSTDTVWDNDYPHFVSFDLGDGSSSLALYQREAAAQDAGVSPEGFGFRGVSFHFIVDSSDAVDEIMDKAVAAGGSIVNEAAKAEWGGYFGYFGDPTATSGRWPLPADAPPSPTQSQVASAARRPHSGGLAHRYSLTPLRRRSSSARSTALAVRAVASSMAMTAATPSPT